MNRTIATLSFATVLAFTSVAAIAQTQPNSDKLSKQQLVSLTASAKTPAEHIRIAQYYGAKAQDYLAQMGGELCLGRGRDGGTVAAMRLHAG